MRRDTRDALKEAAKRNGIPFRVAVERFLRKSKEIRDEYERRAAVKAGRVWTPEEN